MESAAQQQTRIPESTGVASLEPESELVLEPEQMPEADERTYNQILKSTALVGASSALNVGISMVRSKVVALLLGPAGFGLAGIYMSIANLAQSIAGMGISSSGVRQIAEAAGSQDTQRIARTAAVLRRTAILLGVLGAGLLALTSGPVSTLTFGTTQRASAVGLLSLAVFFRLLSDGQVALVQGMRHIGDLAKITVLAAFLGTLITIPLVYAFRERGVAPSLVGVAAVSLLASWWYSRKIRIPIPPMTVSQMGQEAAALLKLGSAFMASALMTMGSAYVVRIIVLHKVGLEGTGLYQSAWTLGGLYVGFILQAMGADFYPRLTSSISDRVKCNRLVNEQVRVSLLLAAPGVLGTLAFAPVVVVLFYSAKFGAAGGLLRWICIGTALRVVSWPMGFVIVARGEQGLFFWTELAWTVVNVGLAWICVGYFGLDGAGMAFCGSYVFHALLIYTIVSRLTGFRWSSENLRTALQFAGSVAAILFVFQVMPFWWAAGVGALAVVLSGAYAVRTLSSLVSLHGLPRPVRLALQGFGLAAGSDGVS